MSLDFDPASLQLVLFDLDGTLIDTLPDIALALDRCFEQHDWPTPGLARARGWVGNGSRMLLARAMAWQQQRSVESLPEAELDAAQAMFFDAYQQCCAERSELYPGVLESLALLRELGIPMACVTNKPARFTPEVLRGCAIDQYFALMLSGDSLARRKPDPLPLQHALDHFSVAAGQALMVGDSENDVLAARAAGVPILAVDYGYNYGRSVFDETRPAAENPDRVVSSLSEFFSFPASA